MVRKESRRECLNFFTNNLVGESLLSIKDGLNKVLCEGGRDINGEFPVFGFSG